MTITNQNASVSYTGNGVVTSFAYAFAIPYQLDGITPAVAVVRNVGGVKTTLVLGVDYTISGVGTPAGGTVVYPITGSPLASPNTLTINRTLAYEQGYSYQNNGLLPSTVEQGMDALEMQIQQLNARLAAAGL